MAFKKRFSLSEKKYRENIVIDFIILDVTDPLSNFYCFWYKFLKSECLYWPNHWRVCSFKIVRQMHKLCSSALKVTSVENKTQNSIHWIKIKHSSSWRVKSCKLNGFENDIFIDFLARTQHLELKYIDYLLSLLK